MLFKTCTKLTFDLSDVFVVTVIARNRINGVGSLFFRDRILRFGENMPQSLKRFLSNFNVVAIQNSLDGFRNTLNVRNNSKTSRWFPFIKRVTSCNLFLAVTEKGFCITICAKAPFPPGVYSLSPLFISCPCEPQLFIPFEIIFIT